ncbi:MAG: GGDEF domain-containing protein [Acidobacteriota bacterium]
MWGDAAILGQADRTVKEWTRPARVALGLTLLLAVGAADYATGIEVPFFLSYWIPVAFVTWYVGGRGGRWTALGSGLLWWAANWSWRLSASALLHCAGETSMRLLAYLLFAEILFALKRSLEAQRELARTDFVTGVANVRLFYETLNRELARSRRSGLPLSLAYLDIDDFKRINDSLGHEGGDRVLKAVAGRLKDGIRVNDLAARLGGDEFALLLPETGDVEAGRTLDRLLGEIASVSEETPLSVECSVGLVTCLDGRCSTEDLVRAADALMYEVKNAGKSNLKQRLLADGVG